MISVLVESRVLVVVVLGSPLAGAKLANLAHVRVDVGRLAGVTAYLALAINRSYRTRSMRVYLRNQHVRS